MKKILTYLFSSISILGFSQIEDSSFLDLPEEEDSIVYVEPTPKRKALPYEKKIAKWSLIPGAGQVINKKYHKAPLFIGGLSYMVYQQRTYNKLYQDLNLRLENMFDDNPDNNTLSPTDSIFAPEALKQYNTSRTLYLFGSLLVYGINLADAKIDAQIKLSPEENQRPKKAALYSSMLPGLGQIYNRKYWKLPLIYGGSAGLYYYYTLANSQFIEFNTAYIQKKNYIAQEEFNTPELYEVTETQLERLSEKYRKKKERAILFMVLLYAGNIIDAAVDAHLANFNINESIDIALSPLQINQSFGFGFNIHFALDQNQKKFSSF